MSEFAEAVQSHREREQHEPALQLLLDRALLKYCGLWTPAVVRTVMDYPLDGHWDSVWGCVQVNHQLLADMADDTEARAKFQVTRLKVLKLIYPDGTRTAMATKAITKYMFDGLRD